MIDSLFWMYCALALVEWTLLVGFNGWTGVYDAIADGLRTAGLKSKLENMAAQLVAIDAKLAAPAPSPCPAASTAEWTDGLRDAHCETLCKIDNRLALAGEHCSHIPAWLEGSLLSS